MIKPLPIPTITRLCAMYELCDRLAVQGRERVTSRQLGVLLGCGSDSVRKDISRMGGVGERAGRYTVSLLRRRLTERLHLDRERRACVVGLGRLGTALLEYRRLADGPLRVVAGFDASVNRLETLRTPVPTYPEHEIELIVRREGIELALLAVPTDQAQGVADRLIAGGIAGILNFAPVALQVGKAPVVVRTVDVITELLVLGTFIDVAQNG